LNAEIEIFLADPALTTQLGAPLVEQLADAFRSLDREADDNPDALEMFDCLTWIISQPRTVNERLGAMCKLAELPKGPTRILSMREFCGWENP
jgi:hypothetical protein